MNSTKALAAFAAVVVMTASFTMTAQAANVVPNPEFATDVSGWTYAGSGTGGFTLDAGDGAPASPSGLISDATIPGGGSATTSACIAITNGNFDLIANVKVGAATTTTPTVTVTFFLTQCDLLHEITTSVIGSFPTDLGNGWMQGSLSDQTAPSNSPLFAQITLAANSATTATHTNFDHILFGPTSTLPVRLQSFDVK